MLPILFAISCGDPPTLTVEVDDIFGADLADAQVKRDGVAESWKTGADGTVAIPFEPGTLELMVGKEGYIHEFVTVEIVVEGPGKGSPPPVKVALHHEAGEPGFYGIGPKGYSHLGAQPINTVATEMSTWHGLEQHPEQSFVASKEGGLSFLFNSTLRAAELKRQDLKLSRLEYKETAQVTGVLGETEVELHLWVASDDIPYEIKGTQSQDDYLIAVPGGLESGNYAFHAQSILHSTEAEALANLPKEMQVAFPFEVK
ncbi:MAG TPA: hypothetical protein QGF58_21260 [Myxococcota bacterium]|nr:hypothetical protein [Myxococcota bacterium]